ncbi:MAG TPA: FUSC family protein, partial [Pararhizobium sp.]|nr:FUSC family protein [Pararhizobium sp.]
RRINLILRQLRHAAREGTVSDEDTKQLRRHTARLRDTILMAEGFLPQGPEGSLAAKGATSDVAVALFHLQLVVERLVRARHLGLPPVDLVQAVLDHDERAVSTFAAGMADSGADEDVAARLLVRLQRARVRLTEALGPAPSPAFESSSSSPPPAPEAKRGGEKARLIPEAFESPIQITLACAIAMGIGLLVSPVRWYWAVITAFIVFNNTRSRGDTAVRALQRSAGTFAGFLVGTGVATLLQGHVLTSTVLIFVLFFLAFYFVQTSYSIMIFFITIALALIYGLMGMFSPEILILRLEETVIGAVAGTLMAFMVFPKRTMSGVSEALEAYLGALDALVAGAAAKACGREEATDLLSLSRALDRKYADLAQLVRPLGGPWNAVTRFGEVRERLLLLSGSAHWGRVLAQSLSAGAASVADDVENIDELAGRLAKQIAIARENKAMFFHKSRRKSDEDRTASRRPLVRSETDHPVIALEAISTMLDHAGWRAPEEVAVEAVDGTPQIAAGSA